MKKYEKYKKIDLPWLSEIPEHWQFECGKRYLKNKKELNLNNNEKNVLSLTLKGVIKNDINNPIGLTPKDYGTYQIFDNNDLVFKLIDLNNIKTSRVGLVNERGIMSSAYLRITIISNLIFSKYLYYWYTKLYLENVYNKLGSGVRETMTAYDLLKLSIPIPPFEEQKQIANYLDWKINDIDKLIEKINLQIIQLNEFKKINIDKKFKNLSGMEYKLKNIFIFGKGLSITKEDLNEEGKFKCINYGEIHRELGFSFNCNTTKLKFLKNDNLINAFALLNKDDFIFCDTSEDYEGCGNFTYLEDSDINNKIYAGYHTVVAKPKIKVNSRYLAYYFMSTVWRNKVIKRVNGVKVYSITQNILKNITVIIPDNYIQLKIIEELDLLVNKINLLIDKHSKIIKKYEELKSSLISEVVTGKIDVRDVIIPKYEKLNINEIIKEDSFEKGIESDDE